MLTKLKTFLRYSCLAGALSASAIAHATSWQETEQQSAGQTVWFNAWGGDASANDYMQWVSQEVKKRYGITLNIVKVADAADVVKRIQSEVAAGRTRKGSVDLMWVNGENFHTLKQGNLLETHWAETLPNWRYVDTSKPVREDFAVPTEGAESPWGSAQLMFIATRSRLANPPDSLAKLLERAKQNPGMFSYPRPPDFIGTAFLESMLLLLVKDPQVLTKAPDERFAAVTEPLWDYLDKLHPLLWRKGQDFPASAARMDRMLADGELLATLTFNPARVTHLVKRQQLPADAFAFGFTQGMPGNVHFVAIPVNSSAKPAAQVVANFLLSPQAQLRKADPAVWGDPTVLDRARLTAAQQQQLDTFTAGAPNAIPVLPEPNAAWIPALEAEWTKRYGSR